jgi:hypothetical protein
MSSDGKKSISDLDAGLRALKKFIKASGIGDQLANRQLVTDIPYQFTITTTLPRRRDQRQADTEVHVVKIPAGSTLYFLRRTAVNGTSPEKVDAADFIVNDGPIGWHVNTDRGSVRRLRHNFGGKVMHIKPKSETQD